MFFKGGGSSSLLTCIHKSLNIKHEISNCHKDLDVSKGLSGKKKYCNDTFNLFLELTEDAISQPSMERRSS